MLEQLDFLRQMDFLGVCTRLFLAMLCGGLVGLDRERMKRAKGLAGFRTYMIVCTAAALTMMISQYEYTLLSTVWRDVANTIEIKTDVSRLGAQVINGIGFLGAGTILITKDDKVRGLTTAAALWASACMGLAVGTGFYECAVLAVVMIWGSMYIFSKLKISILTKTPFVNLYIEVNSMTDLGDVILTLRSHGVHVLELNLDERQRKARTQNVEAEIVTRMPNNMSAEYMLTNVSKLECVNHVHQV